MTKTRIILTGLAASAMLVPAGVNVTSASATTTPSCTNTDLKASYEFNDSGAGHQYGWIVLTNVSGHTCRTGGFGGVSYVGWGNGTQIGAAADRQGPTYDLVVKPGQRIGSPLDETRAVNYPDSVCWPHHVQGFRIYVPNATKSQYVPHPRRGCLNPEVHLMTHEAYRHM